MKIVTNEYMSKVGRYGRPIFWAGLMSWVFSFLVKLSISMFSPFSREVVWSSLGFSIITIFGFLALIVIFAVAVYKVAHPSVHKEGYDDADMNWGWDFVFSFYLYLHKYYLAISSVSTS